MSKDLALLKRVKILLECTSMGGLQRQADTIIEEIREILAESESEPVECAREPVVWQYRTKPNWIEEWNDWENCSKGSYEDYKRVPLLHDWLYETRELYASPPTREPLSDEEIWKICKDHFWIASQAALIKAVEKAHGIG